MALDPKNLSVIVQGPVNPYTRDALVRIRTHFSGSELILSTWEGCDTSGLTFDKLIMSHDPGAVACEVGGRTLNNINRQLVSTNAGLCAASRDFALKTRSDILFKSGKILNYLGMFSKRNPEWCFLRDRVIVNSVFSRVCFYVGKKKTPCLFHPSDWIFLGLTADIRDIFDVPLTAEPGFSNYFESVSKDDFLDPYPELIIKFVPEQYIWYTFLQKHVQFEWSHRFHCTPLLEHISEQSLVNNLIVLDLRQTDIYFPKYPIEYEEMMCNFDFGTLYSHNLFRMQYKRFCDPHYKYIPTYTSFISLPRILFHSWQRFSPYTFSLVRNGFRRLRGFPPVPRSR